MKVRLKDVAQRAGVAVNTASMILNRRPNCWASKQTGERVFKAAAELRYKPSRTAVALRLGKFHTVGLLVPNLEIPHWAQLTQLLQLEMQKHGYDLMIESSHSNPQREASCLESILDRQIDGLIACFMGDDKHLQTLEAHGSHGKPIVAITTSSTTQLPIDSIVLERQAQIAPALDHLAALGHSGATILQSGEAICENPPLDVTYVRCESTLESAFQITSRLLNSPTPPTAILAENDLAALAVMRAAIAQGIDVPSELSILSLESSPLSGFLPIPLTAVEQPLQEIVEHAAALILKRLKDPAHGAPEQRTLHSQLTVRESTAAPSPIHPDFQQSFQEPQTAFVQTA